MNGRNGHNGYTGHYLQTDPRWAGTEWYSARLSAALWRLTRSIQRREREPTPKRAAAIRRALAAFNREVRRVAARPVRSRTTSNGAFHEAGCHIVSQALVLRALGVTLRGREPTPLNLLHALQDMGLVTLSGYSEAPGIDHLLLATDGQVYLTEYADYGRKGLPVKKAKLLRKLKPGRAAIVCVWAHEYLNTSVDWTHYVCVPGLAKDGVIMQDPSAPRANRLERSYKRVFGVWVYTRREERRRK